VHFSLSWNWNSSQNIWNKVIKIHLQARKLLLFLQAIVGWLGLYFLLKRVKTNKKGDWERDSYHIFCNVRECLRNYQFIYWLCHSTMELIRRIWNCCITGHLYYSKLENFHNGDSISAMKNHKKVNIPQYPCFIWNCDLINIKSCFMDMYFLYFPFIWKCKMWKWIIVFFIVATNMSSMLAAILISIAGRTHFSYFVQVCSSTHNHPGLQN
jgi:hypothetical protein